jgi:hypothetical protein
MPLGRTPDRLADRTAGIAPFAATVREAQPSDGSHGEGAMGFTTGAAGLQAAANLLTFMVSALIIGNGSGRLGFLVCLCSE